MSIEESTCEAYFSATTTRDKNGRFVVALPKKPEVLNRLGKSYEIAAARLEANPALQASYSALIDQYLQLGQMKKVFPDTPSTSVSFYLPHHYVVRSDSLTTKLRVVFDASSATDTGISLNDALMVGPVVQEDLVCITIRFRLPRFAITSDIEKMYRQSLVTPSDRPLQQILGQTNPENLSGSYSSRR
ncbi:uncharacterized protein LOC134290844 [Aedes albopictus]|uniref:Uncharacterized protein n=1 Tax=Aedes albopictus TaxID=7160 RepID=A0ABM1YSK4_AEDAL